MAADYTAVTLVARPNLAPCRPWNAFGLVYVRAATWKIFK
eukprot:COSAG05_NODE_22093_length_267_cov_0.613095_1_plen_39_part_10